MWQLLTASEDVPSMAVDPEFQGHGIASRLLQKLCELADQAGQDVYLEGTTAALRLYKKAGFEVLEEVEMLEGVYRLALMLRKPQPTK
jgi:ribosomal protein S18 acetylase RimI-like enzyme